MGKISFKPGNMLYPVPAVLVSCRGKDGKDNILTVAWAGTVCSDPAMVSISVRPSRHSHKMIAETKEFVINLVTEDLVKAADFCGVKSGRDLDKWSACSLHRCEVPGMTAPGVAESPVNIGCQVVSVQHLGTHDLFLAKVVSVQADDRYMDASGRFHLNDAKLICYSHGEYHALGKKLGTFGFSVKKKRRPAGRKKGWF